MKRAPLNALQQVKEAAGVESPSPRPVAADTEPAAKPAAAGGRQASRVGKTNVTGYFPLEVKKALRLTQIKTDKNIQQLLEEALVDLFRKHNIPVPNLEK